MFRSLDTFASTASVIHEASLCPPLVQSNKNKQGNGNKTMENKETAQLNPLQQNNTSQRPVWHGHPYMAAKQEVTIEEAEGVVTVST